MQKFIISSIKKNGKLLVISCKINNKININRKKMKYYNILKYIYKINMFKIF